MQCLRAKGSNGRRPRRKWKLGKGRALPEARAFWTAAIILQATEAQAQQPSEAGAAASVLPHEIAC